MGLVDYSESESDGETAPTAKTSKSSKPAFQKSTTEPGKIRIGLPSLRPEHEDSPVGASDDRPAKRARNGGALSGFNSLLPAPKRAAQNKAPKAGISLRTSGEAAFDRSASSQQQSIPVESNSSSTAPQVDNAVPPTDSTSGPPKEPVLIGKPTRFLPLSVSNKKKASKPSTAQSVSKTDLDTAPPTVPNTTSGQTKPPIHDTSPPAPKPSLFGMPSNDSNTLLTTHSTTTYQPLLASETAPKNPPQSPNPTSTSLPPSQPAASTLETLATDLHLTPAQRRQLLGRNANRTDVNVMHFNLDSEYASNETLRQSGQIVEHRAVKAIAPGKHSLQQLVNNAKSQKDGLEDAWAEGRRNRGESGSKYGWG